MSFFNEYISGNVSDVNAILFNMSDEPICKYMAQIALINNRTFDAIMFLSHPSLKEYSFLFELIKSKNGFISLIEKYENYFSSKCISSELKYVVFMTIVRRYFLGDTDINKEVLIKIYHTMTDSIFNVLKHAVEVKSNDNVPIQLPDSIDAWVLTGQFLTLNHGPTLTTLTVANELKEQGYNVGIICTNSLNFDRSKYSSHAFIGNYVHQYSMGVDVDIELNSIRTPSESRTYTLINYKNNSYPYLSVEGDFLNKISTVISALNNDNLTISIGDSNIFSEFLSRYRKVFNLPCSFEMPIVNNEYPAICRELMSNEEKTSKLYKKEIVETRFPYSTRFNPDNKTKIINGDINIIIIGSRLLEELCDDTLARIRDIFNAFPQIVFSFAGVDYSSDIVNKLAKYSIPERNIEFLGFVNNIENLIYKSTFCLNPRRKGGGTSILESLSLNVPPICFPYGDGFYTAGNFFSFDNNIDVISFMKKYLESPENVWIKCQESFKLNTDVKNCLFSLTRNITKAPAY